MREQIKDVYREIWKRIEKEKKQNEPSGDSRSLSAIFESGDSSFKADLASQHKVRRDTLAC